MSDALTDSTGAEEITTPVPVVGGNRAPRTPVSEVVRLALASTHARQSELDGMLKALIAHTASMQKQLNNVLVELRDINRAELKSLVDEMLEKTQPVMAAATYLQTAVIPEPAEDIPDTTPETLAAIQATLEKLTGTTKDTGIGFLGFDASLEFAEGTVGHTLQSLILSVSALSSKFVNLGDVKEQWVMNKVITVDSTLAMAKCPVKLDSIDLEMIKGGNNGDLLLLTGFGTVVMKVSGNIRLKSEYTLLTGRYIALKKTKDVWEELWRSH